MTVDPRAALDRFTAALESHYAAALSGRGEDDPAFTSAYATLIDAFETYDEALYDATGIDTPFLVYDDEGDDDDDDDYEEEDELDIIDVDDDEDDELVVVEDED